MSYNYEITSNTQKKKYNNSKYTYKSNEADSQTYIFELILKDKSNNVNVIRRIKKCNQGNLITNEENIQYKNVEKFKLTVIDMDFPNKIIVIKEQINHSLTTTTFNNNDIYLEINEKNNGLMDFNYHINLHQ